jgi:hypothetical protein
MATQDGIFKFNGKLDDVIGYRRKGKRCYRRLPKHVRRSIATILSGTDFGTASKAGKLLRRAILPFLDIRTDHTLTNRINREMLQVLYASNQERGSRSIRSKALDLLKGFQFNKATGLDRLLPFFTPKVVQDGDKLRIALPAMEPNAIRHARNTTHIEIKAIAAGLNFNGGDQEQAVSDKVVFRINQAVAATELVLPFKAGKAETIVVLQVRAFSEDNGTLYASGNKKYCAADIIDVIPSLPEESVQKVYADAPSSDLQQTDKTYTAPQKE